MNLSPVEHTVLSMLWWFITLTLLVGILNTPWFKGYVGQLSVRITANLLLDPYVYRPIHYVTLQTPEGTTQIDHIFVSKYGIFVVETKNYFGWIFGYEKQAMWIQKLFKTTTKFQNPLLQNNTPLKALES